MRLGTIIKTGLSAVGITPERVTSVGHAVGLIAPDESCGCEARAEVLDTWSQTATKRAATIARNAAAVFRLSPAKKATAVTPQYPTNLVAISGVEVPVSHLPCGHFLNLDQYDGPVSPELMRQLSGLVHAQTTAGIDRANDIHRSIGPVFYVHDC